jgi:predicted unusual protein kinase regulating ubiquinone biosynthesis (AarF/ABC1/UbiB family)
MFRLLEGIASPDHGKTLLKTRIQQATAVADQLGSLKGAAMKFGQILALEARDFFPDEVVQVLERLQSSAEPLDFGSVEKILRTELHSKYSEIENLSRRPVATASIGQVHTAQIHGRKVAIKVQYPGIADSLDSDLSVLKTLIKVVSVFAGKPEIDYSPFVSEMKEVFSQELNYLHEVHSQKLYRTLAAQTADLRVPEPLEDFCTERVLVQGFEEGITISEAVRGKHLSVSHREHYGGLFLQLYVREFCEWGLVQTDPNLGNFLLRPETGELVLLDFGATRSYSEQFRREYSKLIVACFERDDKLCLNQAMSLGLLDPREKDSARDAFVALLNGSMEPFRSERYSFGEEAYADQMRDLGKALIRELQFSPPPRQILFLHRKLGGIFQILRRLDVTLDLRPFLGPFHLKASPLKIC